MFPTALARSSPMSLTWGEYRILEIAVHAWIPLRSLVHPRLTELFNGPGHHLDERELLDALERLLDRGDVVLDRERPPRADLAAALVHTSGPRSRDPSATA